MMTDVGSYNKGEAKMNIKIEESNSVVIEAALRVVNKHAYEHAYTTFLEIYSIAQEYEKIVIDIVGSKKAAVGAMVSATSGGPVPNTYKYSRVCTIVKMVRRATGWFLVSIDHGLIYKGGWKVVLTLTESQDSIAVARLRSKYFIN